MIDYLDFNKIIEEAKINEYDKNNLISILLLLSTEEKSVIKIASLLDLHNVKVKYYLDFLINNDIIGVKESEASIIMNDIKYYLKKKEILATMDATTELGKKIQARRLGSYLEEGINRLVKENKNTVLLAEVTLGEESIVEINTMIENIYNYVFEEEKMALKEQEKGRKDLKRYSLLTSFIPTVVEE